MNGDNRPNLIVIISDDQGYGDLGCMGADDIATPHLDRLATKGVRFTDLYSNSPVCSPSRAALLTGRHPARTGIRDVLSGHRSEVGFTGEMPTLASVLSDAGYATGLVGKWHLGVAPGSRPTDNGFDEWFGILSGMVDYFSHINYNLWPWDTSFNPVHDLWEDDAEVWRNGRYLTELISEGAVDFLSRNGATEQPFFLQVGYTAPHAPMHAPAEYVDRFPDLNPGRRIMAAMLAAMDDGVGTIIAELERLGQLENTCIFFMSDNGPSRHPANWLDGSMETYYGGSAGDLRGGKTSLFEGGIRAASLLHWPAAVPGGRVVSDPLMASDMFPTFLNAAGVDTAAFDIDGDDMFGVITGADAAPERDLLWEFRDQTAIRRGPWKLTLGGYDWEGLEPEPVLLANLKDDIGESRNLAERHPDIVAELREIAEQWRRTIVPADEDELRGGVWRPAE